ncbi:MAG: hypothetical protein AAF202_04155, partial [Pseudomonadota bacterium]
ELLLSPGTPDAPLYRWMDGHDQRLSWDMGSDGEYRQRKPKSGKEDNGSQSQLMLLTQKRREIFQPRPKNNPNTLR